MDNGPLFDKPADFLLAEYNTLRAELLQLFSTRYQILALGFSAFSAVLAVQAFGAGSAGGVYVVLLYPVLAFFLLNVYISNSRRASRIEKYIKETIEACVKENIGLPVKMRFGWQTYYDMHYGRASTHLRPPFTFGGRFVFPATALVTVIAGFQGVQPDVLALKVTLLSTVFVITSLFLICGIGLALWDVWDNNREYSRLGSSSLRNDAETNKLPQ